MSLIGNLIREITKAATNVGEAIVNGTADVAEVITGPNRFTAAVRDTGVKVLQGAKAITDALVDMGEDVLRVRRWEQGTRSAAQDGPAGPTTGNAT